MSTQADIEQVAATLGMDVADVIQIDRAHRAAARAHGTVALADVETLGRVIREARHDAALFVEFYEPRDTRQAERHQAAVDAYDVALMGLQALLNKATRETH